jgi:hypothetical protein
MDNCYRHFQLSRTKPNQFKMKHVSISVEDIRGIISEIVPSAPRVRLNSGWVVFQNYSVPSSHGCDHLEDYLP